MSIFSAFDVLQRAYERIAKESARRHVRVSPTKGEPVNVQVMGEGFLEGTKARDVGVGGIALYLPHGMSEDAFGSSVRLIVTLPGRPSFVARGLVRHASDSNDGRFVGIQFTDLPENGLAMLEQYIAKLAPPDGPPAKTTK